MAISIRCQNCGRRSNLSVPELLARLRELGFLRREGEPSTELAVELAQSAIADGRWGICPDCGSNGWGAAEAVDEADDAALWGDARHCQQCGAVIPAERLEVFPNATHCARCQQQGERQASADEVEYCPRCGSIMQLKAASSPGATYRMHCPACRKTFR
jgi:RNA polymerase-binding transcription factor DksA